MQVRDIMTQEVSCSSPSTNAAAAAEIMWTQNCGSLPIVEDGGRLIGVVTDRDLFIALGTQNRRPSDLVLGEVIQQAPVACSPVDDVRQALRIMARERIHRLPVVNELGYLQGMLSMDDVLARTDATLKEEAIRTLRAIADHQAHASTLPLAVQAA